MFWRDNPALRSFLSGVLIMSCAVGKVLPGYNALKRLKMVRAAGPASCWYMMALTKNLKYPLWRRRLKGGADCMMVARTGADWRRWRVACREVGRAAWWGR